MIELKSIILVQIFKIYASSLLISSNRFEWNKNTLFKIAFKIVMVLLQLKNFQPEKKQQQPKQQNISH